MATRKKHSPEELVRKSQQADRLAERAEAGAPPDAGVTYGMQCSTRSSGLASQQ